MKSTLLALSEMLAISNVRKKTDYEKHTKDMMRICKEIPNYSFG
jgi:hypothetical protein